MKNFFKRLGFKWQFYYWIIMFPCIIALLILDVFLLFSYLKIENQLNQTNSEEDVVASKDETLTDSKVYQEDNDGQVLDQREESYNQKEKTIDGIVCWGDSLTAGKISMALFDDIVNSYPYKLNKFILNNDGIDIPVYNKGVSSETSITICGRSGAIPYVVEKKFTIPAGKTETPISFKSSLGDKRVDPLRYTLTNEEGIKEGNDAVVSINGVKGILRVEQVSCAVPEHEYFFSRESSGKEVAVDEGTEIIFEDKEKYRSCIPVIYMGTNGGFDDFEELIEQIDTMINYQNAEVKDKYVVIGLHFGEYIGISRADILKLEEMMKEHYGEHYVSVFDTMCDEKRLTELGIEVTDEDREMISNREVPYCIVADRDLDRVHFKDEGYTLLAMRVYDKMKELGYTDELKEQY